MLKVSDSYISVYTGMNYSLELKKKREIPEIAAIY